MSYLLDTNVISETLRPRADPRVLRWLAAAPPATLHVSVLSIGEIRKGVENPALSAAKRQRINLWLEQALAEWLGPRVLAVTQPVAERWGMLMARAGRSLPAIDSLLAATALHHDLQFVTRNVKDFHAFEDLRVLNPWEV